MGGSGIVSGWGGMLEGHCCEKGINELISDRCPVPRALGMLHYRAYPCKLELIDFMTVTHSHRLTSW